MKQSLYDIASELQGIEYALADDAPKDSEEILTNWIATNAKLTDKIDAVGSYYRTLQAQEKMYANEAAYFADKAKTCKNKAQRLKDAIGRALDVLQVPRIDGRLFKLKWQNNGGQVPIEVEDASLLPKEFQRIVIEPDMVAIRTAIEEGQTIKGVTVHERGKHVRVE